ncbi:sensor histidine kinase [Actinomadura viridis]|uniref:sensor histidine kinase n=1 Tax=Actinomadura viridis TaxID=58110 RepID=UPI00369DB01B
MNSDIECGPGHAGRRAVADAAMIAGVGLLVAVTVWARYATGRGPLWLDLAAGAAGIALLPALRRWPVAGALGPAALAALSPAATPAATLGALRVAERRGFRTALAVAAAGIAAHAVQGLWQPPGGIAFGWWLLLITAGYGALAGWGALVRAQRALVASLRERARRAEAEQGRRVAEARMLERTRMAREMHDVLAHRLSLLATYAGALEYRPDAPPERLARAAGVVRAGAHQALDELREVINVLRDEDGDGDGGRPQPVLADIPRLIDETRDAGGRVEVRDAVVEPAALPAAAGRTAYRVVQEALTNARKHAAGRPVRVTLEGRPGERLVIDVRNPLREGTPEPAAPGSGTGLVGLTERVHLAGGRLDHEMTVGEFRLSAWLPWPA